VGRTGGYQPERKRVSKRRDQKRSVLKKRTRKGEGAVGYKKSQGEGRGLRRDDTSP